MTNLLLRALTYPHGVDGYRDAFRPGAGARTNAATVVSITRRTDRAASLLLRPERPLSFAPGQHILVTVEVDGRLLTRCYSLSDSPRRPDGLLELTVAHIPDGVVSGHLVEAARIGETIGLSAPQGSDFILDADRTTPVLLIGGGSGVTPLRSIWRTLLAEGRGDLVTVLLYARTEADAIFADEVRALGGHVVLTRETPDETAAISGRFSPAHLEAAGVDTAVARTWICGPPGLVDAVTDHLHTAAPAARVRTESFAPPLAPADPAAAEGILTFASSGVSAHNDGSTLLEQAELAGLNPTSGCRMGICHSCDIDKHAGVVRDIRTGACDDGGSGRIQICISQAVGDVQLDL